MALRLGRSHVSLDRVTPPGSTLGDAQARAGRVKQARSLFEEAASYANDLGLLSEEVDVESGELIGNFPQAFSHIGLINAAWAIAEVEGEARSQGETASPDYVPRA